MAKYNITASGNQLIIEQVVTLGDFNPSITSFKSPSIKLTTDKIKFYESGIYAMALSFVQINEIDGVAPTDLEDAADKTTALIANFNGGGTAPDFIPLSGTTVGNPVTGDIEFNSNEEWIAKMGLNPITNEEIGLLQIEGLQSRFVNGNGFINYDENDIEINRIFQENVRGVGSTIDHSSNLQDLDYTQKIYVDQRGSVVNTTTATLSASDLNAQYPNAKDGFSVIAPNVIGGGKFYIKAGAGWVYQQILAVV